jgi:hypothetical protein
MYRNSFRICPFQCREQGYRNLTYVYQFYKYILPASGSQVIIYCFYRHLKVSAVPLSSGRLQTALAYTHGLSRCAIAFICFCHVLLYYHVPGLGPHILPSQNELKIWQQHYILCPVLRLATSHEV